MRDLFPDNDSVSFLFFSRCCSSPLPKAFNGTLTDINRSRDEWRLTLKYYALEIADSTPLSMIFFRFFFLSLNHLSDQVQQHDLPWNQHNINDLIKSPQL